MSALAGKRIVNTRAVHQAAELDALIRAYGAEPIPYPCIEIVPPDDLAPLDAGIHQLMRGKFDGLILTSANTVYALATRLADLGYAPDSLANLELHVAVIGAKTAETATEQLGLSIDTLPVEFVAEVLAESLAQVDKIAEARFFLPQSAIAQPLLKQLLSEIDIEVVSVAAYNIEMSTGGDFLLPQISEVDAITFTSGSTVRNFLKRFDQEVGDVNDLDDMVIVCIGTTTAHIAREWAFDVRVVAEEHTLAGMLDALVNYFETQD